MSLEVPESETYHMFKPIKIINRNIQDFKGRNLIIGCSDSNPNCAVKHEPKDFYCIDRDSKIFPDLCWDITEKIPEHLLPDQRFDFIYFENIDMTCFIDRQNNAKSITFKNIYRLLSDHGICAIVTGPLTKIHLGPYESRKYKAHFFSSTILCEYACIAAPFRAGRICSSKWGYDGGLVIIRKSNLDEASALARLDQPAWTILQGEFIDYHFKK